MSLMKKEMKQFYENLDDFRSTYNRLHTRKFDPLPACSQLCPPTNEVRLCLFREIASQGLTPTEEYDPPTLLRKSFQFADAIFPDGYNKKLAERSTIAMCRVQQMLEVLPRASVSNVVDEILRQAGENNGVR